MEGRLRWTGHLVRLDGELAVILTSGKPKERRVQSRPKFRWFDSIKKSKNIGNQQLAAEGVD